MRLHWFLPTGGDARDVLPGPDDPHHRPPDLAYLAQIATACDSLGFDGMLTPCGTGCEDAWLATASLIPLTKRVKFLVAFRPALLSPTLAAQMAWEPLDVGPLQQALHLEHMTLLWVRMVRVQGRSPHMVWAMLKRP